MSTFSTTDESYYKKADAFRQQDLPKGLLDPECAERDEWHRRLLCSLYTLPEYGTWEQIRDAIWEKRDQEGSLDEVVEGPQ